MIIDTQFSVCVSLCTNDQCTNKGESMDVFLSLYLCSWWILFLSVTVYPWSINVYAEILIDVFLNTYVCMLILEFFFCLSLRTSDQYTFIRRQVWMSSSVCHYLWSMYVIWIPFYACLYLRMYVHCVPMIT